MSTPKPKPKKEPLTNAQDTVLQFMRRYFLENQYWPSNRDVQEFLNATSQTTAVHHIRAIVRKGHLVAVPNTARAFSIPGETVQFVKSKSVAA